MRKRLNLDKFVFLAFDHCVEHGPFYQTNLNPVRIANLANEAKISGIILHIGSAKYVLSKIKLKVPLILKVTGKTSMVRPKNQVQALVTSEAEIKKIKPSGLAATVYVGSDFEHLMMQNFARVKEIALRMKIPLIGFFYPRKNGKKVYDEKSVAYAARVGCELGADVVKTYYTGNKESFRKVIEKTFCPVGIAGGPEIEEEKFLGMIRDAIEAGAKGVAVGRNVWLKDDSKAIELLEKIKEIVGL